jgi:hypothetical protein
MENPDLRSRLEDAQNKIQGLQQEAAAERAAAADNKQQALDQLGALLEDALKQSEEADADNKRMAAELKVRVLVGYRQGACCCTGWGSAAQTVALHSCVYGCHSSTLLCHPAVLQGGLQADSPNI